MTWSDVTAASNFKSCKDAVPPLLAASSRSDVFATLVHLCKLGRKMGAKPPTRAQIKGWRDFSGSIDHLGGSFSPTFTHPFSLTFTHIFRIIHPPPIAVERSGMPTSSRATASRARFPLSPRNERSAAPYSGPHRSIVRRQAPSDPAAFGETFRAHAAHLLGLRFQLLFGLAAGDSRIRPAHASPRPPLQPPHQNRHRSAQPRDALRMGRDWPLKPTIRPESV